MLKCVVQDLPQLEGGFNAVVPDDLKPRVTFQVHDFFTPQPVKDADVYFFRLILHDWPDKYAIKILQNTVPAMKNGARVIVVDIVQPPPGGAPAWKERLGTTLDMQMMVALNSKERTQEEWVEEIDALYEGQTNRIVFADGSGSFACSRLCEVVRPETADVLATYGDDFYGGTPVVTRNQFGAGCAYYVATDPEDAFLDEFAKRLLAERRIEPPLEAPPGLEVALRERDAHTVLFLLNHSTEMAQVELPVDAQYRDLLREMPVAGTVALEPRDVRILVHLQ